MMHPRFAVKTKDTLELSMNLYCHKMQSQLTKVNMSKLYQHDINNKTNLQVVTQTKKLKNTKLNIILN